MSVSTKNDWVSAQAIQPIAPALAARHPLPVLAAEPAIELVVAPVHHQPDALQGAPEDEGPCRAVPQTRDQEDDEEAQVEPATQPAAPRHQRAVDVLEEPVVEGHVPSAPDLEQVLGQERRS